MQQPHYFYALEYVNKLNLPSYVAEDFADYISKGDTISFGGSLMDLLERTMRYEQTSKFIGLPVEISRHNHAEIQNAARSLAFFIRAKLSKAKAYKVCQDFGHALISAPITVPAKHIRFDNQIIFVDLPKNLPFLSPYYDASFYASCEVIPRQHEELSTFKKYLLTIHLSPRNQSGFENLMGDTLSVQLDDMDNLAASMHEIVTHNAKKFPKAAARINLDLISYIAKVLLYINSGDPDLRELQPQRERRGLRAFKRANHNACKLPITLVGFNYKKPTLYSKSETLVSTHTRWQPCGKNREQIKLVWVREHVRQYAARTPINIK